MSDIKVLDDKIKEKISKGLEENKECIKMIASVLKEEHKLTDAEIQSEEWIGHILMYAICLCPQLF